MVDFGKMKKPYFIGEIGINHNGDLQIAKKLIDAVCACSWDCAKFKKSMIILTIIQNKSLWIGQPLFGI